MQHLIPCRDTTTAKELAQIYVKHVARYRGLPRSIVTDRGSVTVMLAMTRFTPGSADYDYDDDDDRRRVS